MGILDHDHRRIDHRPDRDGYTAERHDIGVHSLKAHYEEGREHTHRQRHDRDQSRARVPQEQKAHQGHDDKFLDQLGGQVFDRCVDQLRAVIGGDNLHPFGKARLQLFEFGFHCRNRAPRVGSLPQDDDTACNLAFTVQLGDAAPQFRTDLDIRDIAERDRHAARFGAQRNAAEIRQSSEITRCTDHIFRFAHLDN